LAHAVPRAGQSLNKLSIHAACIDTHATAGR
jgi:hypothetical protein